jgi:hypothetical protein
MGASIHDVGKGDAVKLVGGRVVRIESVSKNVTGWDSTIVTEEGCSYGMMKIRAYGKRVEEN